MRVRHGTNTLTTNLSQAAEREQERLLEEQLEAERQRRKENELAEYEKVRTCQTPRRRLTD